MGLIVLNVAAVVLESVNWFYARYALIFNAFDLFSLAVFTGEYIPPLCFRQGKIYWAEKLARELGGEVSHSTFYTDSITDLPLLERVKNPRVVNPDPKLRNLARKRGWPILDFATPPGKKKKAS